MLKYCMYSIFEILRLSGFKIDVRIQLPGASVLTPDVQYVVRKNPIMA